MNSPTPEQIIAARHSADQTQTEAGRMVFASLRAWQYWEAGGNKMPPEIWLLYMLLTGKITIEQARKKIL